MNTDMSGLFNQNRRTTDSTIPDPFVMYSTTAYPKDLESVFRLCEYMWFHSGQYKLAMQRVVRYFLTKVEIDGDVSKTEKTRYLDYLYDHLKIMEVLGTLGDDAVCYGNSLSSLYMPFNRVLFCKKCGLSRAMQNIKTFSYSAQTKTFSVYCPACKAKTEHDRKDLRSSDETRIHVIRWNVHEIQMSYNMFSGNTAYIWEPDGSLRSQVKSGNEFILRELPWEVIETCSDNHRLRFSSDTIYHMKEETICGVRNRGWGIPRILALFKDAYYVQLLKRYNEALALDHVVPFRVLSPAADQSGDPLQHSDMGSWSSNIQAMLAAHRKDPAGWHTSPFPLQYQLFGAEGASMAPVQLIKQGSIDLMDAMGVPVEMYQGTMSIQAAPMAMRLFQATWPQVPAMLNGWLQWLVDSLSELFGWGKVKARLQPVPYADDLERKNILLQLMSAQKVSEQTALGAYGIDTEDEQKRILEEAKAMSEAQAEFAEDEAKKQELQALAQGGGQMAAGGGPMMGAATAPMGSPQIMTPGTPQGPMSPDQVLQQAADLAQQLMAMPETQRKSQLIDLKRSDPLLHAAVRQQMQNMEQEASAMGVTQMRQQMQSGGAMM